MLHAPRPLRVCLMVNFRPKFFFSFILTIFLYLILCPLFSCARWPQPTLQVQARFTDSGLRVCEFRVVKPGANFRARSGG